MITNPVFRNKFVTGAICTTLSVFYSLFLGWLSNFTYWQMCADGWIFGIIMKIELIMMWYVLKYSTIGDATTALRVFYRILFGVAVVVSVMGIETGLMYFVSGDAFQSFLLTIPTRMFIMALIYIMIVRYYEIQLEKELQEDVDGATLPAVEETSQQTDVLDHITVRNGRKIKMISLPDLICIRAEGDYVELITDDGRWLKELTMKYLEEHLPVQDFVRVHRSYIVRLACISRVERYGQQQLVELRNGEKIRISATGYKQLRQKLNL